MPADSLWRVKAFDCVDSTNRLVKQALRAGDPEGLCAVSFQQKGGYGRQGRVWESPVGGLYFSCGLSPQVPLMQLPLLSLVVSLALRCTLAPLCEEGQLRIKWPNDLLYGQGKLAGISLEAVGGGVCVGIGINVFEVAHPLSAPGKYARAALFKEMPGVEAADALMKPLANPPTNLLANLPANPSANPPACLTASQQERMKDLLVAVLKELQSYYRKWCTSGLAPFLEEYRHHLAFVGSAIKLETVDGTPFAQGTLVGINEQGQLLVETADGTCVAASSGEVHVSAVGTFA